MRKELVVLGFPKCGTTALMREFEIDADIQVLRTTEGNIEVSWPEIRYIPTENCETQFLAHKFTSYIFSDEALTYLESRNPESRLVLCIRNPRKALISWHRMHSSIARSGRYPNHFAWKERDFYANCDLIDYYQNFAARRMRYDRHFERLLSIVDVQRITVVSQERMARDIRSVASHLKSMAAQGVSGSDHIVPETLGHRGYADEAKVTLPTTLENELNQTYRRLIRAVTESGVDHLL